MKYLAKCVTFQYSISIQPFKILNLERIFRINLIVNMLQGKKGGVESKFKNGSSIVTSGLLMYL